MNRIFEKQYQLLRPKAAYFVLQILIFFLHVVFHYLVSCGSPEVNVEDPYSYHDRKCDKYHREQKIFSWKMNTKETLKKIRIKAHFSYYKQQYKTFLTYNLGWQIFFSLVLCCRMEPYLK